MPVSTLSSTPSTLAATSTASSSSRAGIANNFDQFLQILTTQLKNQSPLDPLDTNQFTQQLVQFAGVEQQLKTNDTLATLVSSAKAQTVANAQGLVGARVNVSGNRAMLANKQALWQLNAPRSGTANVVIKNAAGTEVASQTLTLTGGDQSFKWDGKMQNGQPAPDGAYTITLAAKDANGQTLSVKTQASGIVDMIDVSGTEPVLQIGSLRVPMSDVLSIQK